MNASHESANSSSKFFSSSSETNTDDPLQINPNACPESLLLLPQWGWHRAEQTGEVNTTTLMLLQEATPSADNVTALTKNRRIGSEPVFLWAYKTGICKISYKLQ